jgi:predicted AAA+ superfamily ATPase
MNRTRRPQLYIIAGPNGAGKTTFARKFLPDYAKCLEFVNVDLIASGLSPFDPERAALKRKNTGGVGPREACLGIPKKRDHFQP